MENWVFVILTTGNVESTLKASDKDNLESLVNHGMFDTTVKRKG
jgi:hypothetical protein